MYGSLTFIVIIGVKDVGGMCTLIERNSNSTRLDAPP